jgi:hypothetical protein
MFCFLITGPPTTPPKSFCRSWGFGRWLKLENQSLAILDVLEHGEDAEDAERWLLSKDFDALQSLLRPEAPFLWLHRAED